jgi:general secretion pathway protein G
MVFKNLLTYSFMALMLVYVSGCQSDEEKKKEERKIQGRLNASIEKASMDIMALDNALGMYKLDNHSFPTTEHGLDALINKPTSSPELKNYRKDGYVKALPQDPWGNEYIYVIPGKHNPNKYDLFSKGPDGKADTEDDIGNWR